MKRVERERAEKMRTEVVVDRQTKRKGAEREREREREDRGQEGCREMGAKENSRGPSASSHQAAGLGQSRTGW